MAVFIKELRKKKGIPQKILAEKLGVAPSYIARIESGERALTNEWVVKLTKALNCEPWELCDDTDYFFSRDNLHKLFKNSINFTGDNSNFQNIIGGHSNAYSSPDNNKNENIFEKELIEVCKQLPVRKQHDLLGYAYGLLDEIDQEN